METHSFNKAQEQAEEMQKKIETGEAKNYPEANKLITKEAKVKKKLQKEFDELLLEPEHHDTNFCYYIDEARRKGLKIDEEVDRNLSQLMESKVYNEVLKYYNRIHKNERNDHPIEVAVEMLSHMSRYLIALNSLKVKNENFVSGFGLLVGCAYESNNCFEQALPIYDTTGNVDK